MKQCRLLYRKFLFLVIDGELLSAREHGDSSRLLVQFASLLIFIGGLLALPAWNFGTIEPPQARLMNAWSLEHFLIATTMLVVGLFAVLLWDALFPDRRDVLILAPLPIPARTIFFAKLAALASALGLAVACLHLIAGIVWPVMLGMASPAFTMPAFTSDRAMPPVGLNDVKAMLDRDLARAPDLDAVIGVSVHGERRIFAYGAATPDSMFEIGSITKTMTATVLAHMAADHVVQLDEPVRDLLEAPSLGMRAAGRQDITLRDLATHHSGLPVMDPYYRSGDRVNPYAGYDVGKLLTYLHIRGLERKPLHPQFAYSNIGFGLLGYALAMRSGKRYATLVHDVITGPLRMDDTAIDLSPDQQRRFIQGYNAMREPMPRFEVGVLASAGAVVSTASDMLTWLEANLDAEQMERTRAGPLAADLAATHRIQADAGRFGQVGLSWFLDPSSGIYGHGGAALGHTADVFFDPARDTAAVVLSNVSGITAMGAGMIGGHLRARLTGRPAVTIEDIPIAASDGGLLGKMRVFAAYWITMIAAATFMFCAVMCVQGLAAQLLPRRAFLRISSWLQLAAFALIVGVYGLQALAVSPRSLVAAQQGGWWTALPSYWFLALLQSLSGSPAMASLTRGAWLGLALAIAGAALAYALSYFRGMQRIVEDTDIRPTHGAAVGSRLRSALASTRGWRGWRGWGVVSRSPLSIAIVHFSVRTLLRSPQHRVILAFYWGIGFALAIFFLKTPRSAQAIAADVTLQQDGILHDPVMPILASLFMMGLAVLGARVAFSLPRDLRSNWIFRIAPIQTGTHGTIVDARRRALAIVSVLPVWLASAALFLTLSPWRFAAGHLIVLALLGMLLVEIALHHGANARNIPFTCAYVPGRSTIHMTLWIGLAVLLPLTLKAASLELQLLQDEDISSYAMMLIPLLIACAAARWHTTRLTKSEDLPLLPQFEEERADDAVALNVWDTITRH